MRFSSYALPALAANLVAALPAPQEIDLDMVLDTPDPTFSEAVGVVAQTITYDTASLIAVATAAASSVSIEISDVLSQTAVVSKRAAPATCVPQPSGATSAPTYAAGTDNAANFLANNYYASVASAAPTPTGYNMAFVNQQASNNAFGYLGFDSFDTYDVATCASRCSAKNGCVSINIYFERDPSVDPNAASCSNPASVTMIKCVYWGGPVSQDNAVNTGQTRGSFSVVIAGSNGYVTNQIKTPAGYQAGTPYGKYAINAPYDAQGYNTFMGSKIFTSTWDVASCSAYCDSQTAYNKATAPKDGTPYKVCNFFNTYVLTAYKADGTVVPQGQYCALYTEAWTSTYATNAGQWRGQDQYLVNYSFGYSKVNPGVSPTVGDVKGAVYQAVADIKWNTLQSYCSAALSYSTPVVTAYTTVFTTPSAVTTVTTTSTTRVPPVNKRDVTASASASLTINAPRVPAYSDAVASASAAADSESAANKNRKRALPTSTPADLKKYPSAVIVSACSLQATPVTQTSTSIVVVTQTAATVFSTTTAVVAATATATTCSNFRMKVSAPGSIADGKYLGGPDSVYWYLGSGMGYYSTFDQYTFNLDQATGRLSTNAGHSLYHFDFDNPGGLFLADSDPNYPLAKCAVNWVTLQVTCSSTHPDYHSGDGVQSDAWSSFYVENDDVYPFILLGSSGDTRNFPATLQVVCP